MHMWFEESLNKWEPQNHSLLRCCQGGCCIASECLRAEALAILRGIQAAPLCISVKLSPLLQQGCRNGEEGQVCVVQQGVQGTIRACHQHRLLCLHRP